MAPAAGKARGAAVLVVAWAVGAVRVGCIGGDDPAASTLLRAYLAEVGPQVIQPGAEALRLNLETLAERLPAWIDTGGGQGDAMDAARAAFGAAMVPIQRLEAQQVGPAASSIVDAEGQDLRDRIYYWPGTNLCRIDQEIVAGAFQTEGWVDAALADVRGMGAVEYLLFHDGEDNACAAQVDINSGGAWVALGPAEVRSRRARFAAVLVEDTLDAAFVLSEIWADGHGETFAEGDPAERLDELLRAFLYLDTHSKDQKLAIPLGILACAGCSTDPESAWADLGVDHLRDNLRGFEALWSGTDSGGFDTLLRDAGHAAVAVAMADAIAGTHTSLDAVPGTFKDVRAADPAPLVAVHASLKGVTDLLKGDVPTALGLHLPAEAAGDAD